MKASMPVKTILILGALMSVLAVASPVEERLAEYSKSGISTFDAARGENLWRLKQDERACTSCHGNDPAEVGKHVKTAKPIDPMAPSRNAERFSDARKTAKWFKRNCKWTFGRECTAQEQADILAWLGQQ
jgi:hypothetical protein